MLKRFLLILLFAMPLGMVAQTAFPLPDVPKTLRTPQERANYLALHYWDRYDFGDYSLIGNKDVSEQGFSNFISIMPYVTEKDAAFEQLASRLDGNVRMLRYFVALGEKYLAEPLSPVYDEELYILLLEKVVALKKVEEQDKKDIAFDLKMAKKNRIGTKATDFSYVTRDGKRGRLSGVKGEYTLLFLGDPECDMCVSAKEELLASPLFNNFVDNGRLKVLYVCVEGKTDAWLAAKAPKGWIDGCDDRQTIYKDMLYAIPGLPVLYLLDDKGAVLLKNVYPVHVLEFLRNVKDNIGQ